MSMIVQVDATAVEAAFRAAPVKVIKGLNTWVRKTALRTEREAKMQAKDRVFTGTMQNSIHSVFGNLSAAVKPTAKYAIFAHEGRKPGKMPPYQPGTELNTWALRKGFNPFLLARSIGRKGVKPDRFMDRAFQTVKPVAELDATNTLADIVRSI